MKLKTTASIIVTSIPFQSFPLPSKETSQNHQSTTIISLQILYFLYLYLKKKGRKKKEKGTFSMCSSIMEESQSLQAEWVKF